MLSTFDGVAAMANSSFRQFPGSISPLPLTHITFYDQHACDLGCRHCSAGPYALFVRNDQKALSKDQILTAIHEALPLGLMNAQFGGGDILQHPEIIDLLDQLEKIKLSITIETNGSGLTSERAAQLIRIPRCNVILGLDGVTPETHDLLHGKPGAYEQVTSAARLLHQVGLPIQLVFNVQRQNAGQIVEMIHLAEDLGASSLRFVVPRPDYSRHIGENGHNTPQPFVVPDEALSIEELIALGWRIERKLAATTPMHLLFDQPPVFRGLHPAARIEDQNICNILNSLSVTNSGDYVMCGLAESIPDLVFGKVGRDPLEQIWKNHPVLNSLRSGLPDQLQGICDRCILKSACLGNCPAENYLRSGSFFGAYWFCEAADRAGLFPAGRLIENHW